MAVGCGPCSTPLSRRTADASRLLLSSTHGHSPPTTNSSIAMTRLISFSVDHGHFLPGGPTWSIATLAAAPPPTTDPQFNALGLDPGDYAPFVQRLEAVTPRVIASFLSRVHASWGVTDTELAALGEMLLHRAPQAVPLFPR